MRTKIPGLFLAVFLLILSLLLALSLQAVPLSASGESGSGEQRSETWTELTLEIGGEIRHYREETVRLIINGAEITYFDGGLPPIILEDRVFLPLRDTFELLGAEVTWSESLGQTLVSHRGVLAALRADAPVINVSGTLMPMELPARIINGRFSAPFSLLADIFDFEISWQGETRTVFINSGAPPSDDYQHIHSGDDGPLFYEDPHDALIPEVLDETAIAGPALLELSIDANPAPLPVMDFPNTFLAAIEYSVSDPRAFTIRATSPISRAERFLLPDNRLVLDIYGMDKFILENEFLVESPFLQRVRVAQHTVTPELITRVVFDLLEPVSYSVTFTECRTGVTVNLLRNEILNVDIRTEGVFDYITIEGRLTPVVNIFPLTAPGVLIADIPLGIIDQPITRHIDGVFAFGVRATQLDAGTARVSIDLKREAAFNVTHEGTITTIRLMNPTIQNISYDSRTSRLTIPKIPGLELDIRDIVQYDDYLNFMHRITLPGDFSAHFGQGNLVVNDRFISHIAIETNGGNTDITFFQQRIMAYTVWEDAENIYVQVLLPRDKYSRIVIIDPGHGGADPGATEFYCDDVPGMLEKDLVLDIGLRLYDLLRDSGIKAYMTRKTDVGVPLNDRADFANGLGDLFISLHLNSSHHPPPGPYGTEIYWWPGENDHLMGFSSERAAEVLLENILRETRTFNRGVRDYRAFRVLVNTTMPAVLVEYAFIRNPSDANLLRTESFRQRAAEGTFNGILEIFREYTPRR